MKNLKYIIWNLPFQNFQKYLMKLKCKIKKVF